MRSPLQVGMISTLLMSPYLGAWVDLTPRLRAATTLTVVQVKNLPLQVVSEQISSVSDYSLVLCEPWSWSPPPLLLLLHPPPPPPHRWKMFLGLGLGLVLVLVLTLVSTHPLLLLTVVLGTAALGGLAAGGITLLIQVPNAITLLIQVIYTINSVQLVLQLASSERLVGCYLRGQPGQPCKGQLCISGS